MLQVNLLTKVPAGEEIPLPMKMTRRLLPLQKCTKPITANAGTQAPMMFPTNISGLSKLKPRPRRTTHAVNALTTVSTMLPSLNRDLSITDLEAWAGLPTLVILFMLTKLR